jgi:hypothetical protein
MNHALRNSLILFVILVVIIGLFYFNNNNITQEIEVVEASLRTASRELQKYEGIQPDTLRLAHLRAQYSFIENWTAENSKFFLAEDNTRISWAYLQEITRRFNPNFQFNFNTVSRPAGNDYSITGSSRVSDLYAFLNFIEGLGALYTIENMSINPMLVETDEGIRNEVSFTILLRPWVDRSKGRNILNTPFRRVSYTSLPRDPFRAAIHNPMTDAVQERLLKHDNLRFISFTRDQAFFLSPDNQVITLKPNDPVAYGNFSHIDRNNRAVFRINRTGIIDTVYINLEN